jgi:hypothetical protein
MREFPVYKNHEIAKQNGCFNCHTDLRGLDHYPSGYPVGSGHYKIKCNRCGFTMWYDLCRKMDGARK